MIGRLLVIADTKARGVENRPFAKMRGIPKSHVQKNTPNLNGTPETLQRCFT
jgi:hypothetical protein